MPAKAQLKATLKGIRTLTFVLELIKGEAKMTEGVRGPPKQPRAAAEKMKKVNEQWGSYAGRKPNVKSSEETKVELAHDCRAEAGTAKASTTATVSTSPFCPPPKGRPWATTTAVPRASTAARRSSSTLKRSLWKRTSSPCSWRSAQSRAPVGALADVGRRETRRRVVGDHKRQQSGPARGTRATPTASRTSLSTRSNEGPSARPSDSRYVGAFKLRRSRWDW